MILSWILRIVGISLIVGCGVLVALITLFSMQGSGPMNNAGKVREYQLMLLLIVGALLTWLGFVFAS